MALQVDDTEAENFVLAPLPLDLAERILVLVPVDSRLRCREVARRWRSALSDARLWRDLDMGKRSLSVPRSIVLMQTASALAGGSLVRVAARPRS